MKKEIEITVEQLATLLWIKALDDFEDDVNITLRDKYYNFIENNSVIEGMETEKFNTNKEILIALELLQEDEDNITITKSGRKVIKLITKIEKKNGERPFENKENKRMTYDYIKKIIDENINIIQVALTTLSILIAIIK